jgi:hypothetical protein
MEEKEYTKKRYLLTLDKDMVEEFQEVYSPLGVTLSGFLNNAIHEAIGFRRAISMPKNPSKMTLSEISVMLNKAVNLMSEKEEPKKTRGKVKK